MDVIQEAGVKSKAGRKKKAIILDDNGLEIKSGMIMHGFRLSVDDTKIWERKVRESGLSKSKFFRQAVIENKTTVKATPTVTS